MFSWLVKRIDAILAADRPTVPSGLGMKPTSQFGIGILDIFGFEDFKINGFDQLLINLANENLHHFFNNHIFVQELVEFEKEEIDLSLYEGIMYEPFTLAPRRSVARHVYPLRPCPGRLRTALHAPLYGLTCEILLPGTHPPLGTRTTSKLSSCSPRDRMACSHCSMKSPS
jgi:hypothetical protein